MIRWKQYLVQWEERGSGFAGLAGMEMNAAVEITGYGVRKVRIADVSEKTF